MQDVVDGVELFPPLGGSLFPRRGSLGRMGGRVVGVHKPTRKGDACFRTSARALSWMLLTWEQEVREKMQSGSALGTATWLVGDFEEGALRFGKDRAPQLRLCVAGDTKLVGQETDDRFQ